MEESRGIDSNNETEILINSKQEDCRCMGEQLEMNASEMAENDEVRIFSLF